MGGVEFFAESACRFLQRLDRKETQCCDSPRVHEANTCIAFAHAMHVRAKFDLGSSRFLATLIHVCPLERAHPLAAGHHTVMHHFQHGLTIRSRWNGERTHSPEKPLGP
jgi:hypothetical protein